MHRNIIDLQRAIALNQMGKEARELMEEAEQAPTEWESGHIKRDADRVLDDMVERMKTWDRY